MVDEKKVERAARFICKSLDEVDPGILSFGGETLRTASGMTIVPDVVYPLYFRYLPVAKELLAAIESGEI